MIISAILTVVGSDRPGLTASLAGAVTGVGGNWLESHLARLRGVYVGSVLVELPNEQIHELHRALAEIDPKGLRVDLLEVAPAQPEPDKVMALEVLGQDRPGIVHEVTAALSSAGVNITSFESETQDSSWSGVRLFRAFIEVTAGPGTSDDGVRDALESISGDLMVDFDAAPSSKQPHEPSREQSMSSPSVDAREPA